MKNDKYAVTFNYNGSTIQLPIDTPVMQTVIDVAIEQGMDTKFLHDVFMARDSEYYDAVGDLGVAKTATATLLTKLALTWLKSKRVNKAHHDIMRLLTDTQAQTLFNTVLWGRPRLKPEDMRLMAITVMDTPSEDSRTIDAYAIEALVRFVSTEAVGKAVGKELRCAFLDALSDRSKMEESVRRFASTTALSNLIFETLDLDYQLTDMYKNHVSILKNCIEDKPNVVGLMACKVIVADNKEDAQKQLDESLKEIKASLQQQLDEKWDK